MKKTTYNEAEHEQDSRRMMEHISKNKANCEAAEQGRNKEQAAEQEKTRRKAMRRNIAACAVTLLAIAAVVRWMNAGLIDPDLALPATYSGTGYFGWALHKVVAFIKKEVC